VGDERILALALNNRGDVALTVGDYGRAEPLFGESLGLLRMLGDTANIARSLFNLGAVDLMVARFTSAAERFSESLALSDEAGDKEDLAWCLEGLAGLSAATGGGDRAALLLGAAQSLLEQMGGDFKPFERRLHETTRDQASALCGADELATLAERGASLGLVEAVELAQTVAADVQSRHAGVSTGT
jgi:tetratricopeptide (TPR) repeat protein